jgi:hypothetical protein
VEYLFSRSANKGEKDHFWYDCKKTKPEDALTVTVSLKVKTKEP